MQKIWRVYENLKYVPLSLFCWPGKDGKQIRTRSLVQLLVLASFQHRERYNPTTRFTCTLFTPFCIPQKNFEHINPNPKYVQPT